MDACNFWENAVNTYERRLSEAVHPSEQLRFRETVECVTFILSIHQRRVVAHPFWKACPPPADHASMDERLTEGVDIVVGAVDWERQKQACVCVLAATSIEDEKASLNNYLKWCLRFEEIRVKRSTKRLSARLTVAAELVQDRREVEGLLAHAQREAERERKARRGDGRKHSFWF
jgi:hypothetical protein